MAEIYLQFDVSDLEAPTTSVLNGFQIYSQNGHIRPGINKVIEYYGESEDLLKDLDFIKSIFGSIENATARLIEYRIIGEDNTPGREWYESLEDYYRRVENIETIKTQTRKIIDHLKEPITRNTDEEENDIFEFNDSTSLDDICAADYIVLARLPNEILELIKEADRMKNSYIETFDKALEMLENLKHL